MSEQNELLPCPFCGAEGGIYYHEAGDQADVGCTGGCEITPRVCASPDPEEEQNEAWAIEQWNTRAVTPAPSVGECIEEVRRIKAKYDALEQSAAARTNSFYASDQRRYAQVCGEIISALEALKGKAPELRGGYRAGMLHAAKICKDEFNRSPYAAKDRSSSYMSGYEDACDHLSVAIEQAAVIDCVSVLSPVDVEAVRQEFTQTAIDSHIGWKHPRQWASCDVASCCDRKRLIESLTTVPSPEGEVKK